MRTNFQGLLRIRYAREIVRLLESGFDYVEFVILHLALLYPSYAIRCYIVFLFSLVGFTPLLILYVIARVITFILL